MNEEIDHQQQQQRYRQNEQQQHRLPKTKTQRNQTNVNETWYAVNGPNVGKCGAELQNPERGERVSKSNPNQTNNINNTINNNINNTTVSLNYYQ